MLPLFFMLAKNYPKSIKITSDAVGIEMWNESWKIVDKKQATSIRALASTDTKKGCCERIPARYWSVSNYAQGNGTGCTGGLDCPDPGANTTVVVEGPIADECCACWCCCRTSEIWLTPDPQAGGAGSVAQALNSALSGAVELKEGAAAV